MNQWQHLVVTIVATLLYALWLMGCANPVEPPPKGAFYLERADGKLVLCAYIEEERPEGKAIYLTCDFDHPIDP